MKSILQSIKPQYCELIARGKKTIEVRKTRPKLDVPFKVYIYCTRGKWRIADWIISYFPEHKVYCEPFFGSGAEVQEKIFIPKHQQKITQQLSLF